MTLPSNVYFPLTAIGAIAAEITTAKMTACDVFLIDISSEHRFSYGKLRLDTM